MRVSVVICTYNRADGLRATLDSLHLQRHRDFEVVVVNGPSTDRTGEMLREYPLPLRVVDNPLANLSVSRNLGIRAAAGDIVAFIDDDALPEPAWLVQALPSFADPEVAGVGGVVLDHTGMSFQYRYSAASRFGDGVFSMEEPFDDLCTPGAATFPYLQGTNALFRRTALAQIGLFDETFDFYLDETDVCCRLVDAGYVLRQLPDAPVHHKYLPSARRNAARVTTNWWSIVRNYVYFGYRHGLLNGTELDVIDGARRFLDGIVRDAWHHEELGRTERGHAERARRTGQAAILEGMRLGREVATEHVGSVALRTGEFQSFLGSPRDVSLRVVLVSSGYTPNLTGGIARFISDVAPELARRGHEVRVFTRSQDVGTVDLEDGVWVHRLPPAATPGLVAETSQPIDAFATAVADEIERISPWWAPDVMYGSLWDVEMLGAARAYPGLPVVPMLATPVAEVAEHEGWDDADHPFHPAFQRLVELEREMVGRAVCIHAISDAIVGTFDRLYPGALSHDRIEVAQIGRADDVHGRTVPLSITEPCVLFVGRLEPRKGIDVFLTAARVLLTEHDGLRIVVAGDISRPGPTGRRYPEWWATLPDLGIERLSFRGMVDDEELSKLMDESTVIVMPSRYESFGLVAVEAMMHGRPVVASDVGGLAEVVENGESGLLVPVDDARELAAAITRLVTDPEFATSIAERGRRHFEAQLTATAAAERLELGSDRGTVTRPIQDSRMRVAIVTGICVARDAISAAAVDQARTLSELDGVDEVVLIAQHHDRKGSTRIAAIGDPWSLVQAPAIENADLVIFHWGIRYQLFDALPLVAHERQAAVHFHNLTPAHLVPESDRELIEQSTRQIQLPLLTGTKVWTESNYNLATLHNWGYPDEQTRLVPLTVGGSWPQRQPGPRNHLRLLTVGRLVPAKGVGILVEAMTDVVRALDGKVSLVLAGSAELSNRDYISELAYLIRELGLEGNVDIKEDLDDRALALEYERADVLVSPSLHEGLCVPVIEAYRAGCNVVGTDAGNLPSVVQPPDPVVPAGDPDALANAIVAIGRQVLEGANRVPAGAAGLIATYAAENTRRELAAAVVELGPFDPPAAADNPNRRARVS